MIHYPLKKLLFIAALCSVLASPLLSQAPTITSINPNSGQPGQTLTVNITGENTHFVQGKMTVSFGTGITVNSVTVSSTTQLSTQLSLSLNAKLGTRNVTVETHGATKETVRLADGFTVTGSPLTPVISAIVPASGRVGTSFSIVIVGQNTHFVQGKTSVSLGSGTTVGSVTVISPMRLTAQLTIGPNASPGLRRVTVASENETARLEDGFTVTAGPAAISSLVPDNGQAGTSLSVTVNGQNTGFVQGFTQVSLGASVTVSLVTVNSATSLTADLDIPKDAAVGKRTLTVTTGSQVVPLPNVFEVTPPAVLSSITPDSGRAGTSLTVTITGQFTHFIQGTTQVSLGSGITVNSVTVAGATSLTAQLSIATNATVGLRTVTVTTGAEVVTLIDGFSILPPLLLTSVLPNSGSQGQALSLVLTAQNTNFVQGVTQASVGADISVGDKLAGEFGPVIVVSPTVAIAVVKVADTATAGARTVVVKTGTEQVTLENGFTVTTDTPAPPNVLELSATTVPAAGQPALTNLTVAASSVPQVEITASQFRLLLEPAEGVTGPAVFADAIFVSGGMGSTRSVTFQIPSSLTFSSPTAYQVTLFGSTSDYGKLPQGVTFASGNKAALTINPAGPAPSLSSVQPNSGSPAQTLNVTITGQGASFVQGLTEVSLGAGITVNSLTVAGPTSLTAQVTIAADAAIGSRTVTVTTAAEIAGLPNGFTVQAAPLPPTITSIIPNTGAQGQTLGIEITGQNTSFLQGSTTISFGSGVTVNTVTVASATSLTANVSIASNASVGARTVAVTTGTEVASLSNGFTVNAGVPAITLVNPNSGQQGQTLDVAVTGQFTSFVQGTTVVGFGAGITVNTVTVTNATSLTANISIAANAASGVRTVTTTTGAEVINSANGFTVGAGTPVITLVNPNSGQQGQTLDVAVTGQFSNFVQGTTVASFGAGITVNTVTVTNATSLTANVSIAANSAAGGRTVTVTTGTEVANLVNAFTVGTGTPVIISVSPNSGQQGQTLNVAVTGQFTNFVQGTTVVSFGAGITVNTVSVTTATALTANISIASNATAGSRTVTVTTGAETVSLVGGFTVNAGADTQPPTLTINSPASGSTVFVSKPSIQLSYSDPSGVDLASLTLTANGQELTVNCQLSSAGGSCSPLTALPEGAVTLVASLKDLANNQATQTVQFTVDSVPIQISITSPANGLITKVAEIQVNGTVGSGINLVQVNGLLAAVSGGSYSVTVPLREGVNMIVAVAASANNKTGTASIEVTRDIVAPIVRIQSPRDGLVSANTTIDVAGQVNDIVNGATNAEVRVNGVKASVSDGAFLVTGLPIVNGPNTIEAVATDKVGNEGRHSIQVTVQVPAGARVSIFAGNGQSGTVRQALPQSLVAVVKDELGNPVAGRVLRFEVTRNSGTLRLTDSDPPQRVLQVPSDGSGKAAVRFALGDTAGQGTNRVAVTGLGVAGEVEFCATAVAAPPEKILMTMGDNQRGVVAHPLATPLEALVVDKDGNPIGGVNVSFTVLRGNGHLNGQQTLVVPTASNGLARTVLTLGPDPSINNNVVNATFVGLVGLPATFTASGLAPGNPAETRFSGVVLDNGHTPIPGSLVTIPGTSVSGTTDAQGQFLLQNVPVGHIHLRIDPSNSPRPETFPPLEFETVTVAGQTNTLGQPILIPALDTAGSKIVGGNQDVILTMKGVAGLELTVFANSVTCPPGTPDRSPDGKQCRVTISQVHLDKVPMPPPSGTFFMPPAWTVQPAGVHFNPPARISIPNDGLPPGRVIDIFQFDHSLNQFINIGKGTVSADASVIVSDSGFGITAAGWGGCGQPQPPTTCTNSCNDNNDCTADQSTGPPNCACANSPVPDGAMCDSDGDSTADGTCLSGRCSPATEFDPNTGLKDEVSIPWVKNNIQVSPGERMIFNLLLKDVDRRRPKGTSAWQQFTGKGPYKISLIIQGPASWNSAGSGTKVESFNSSMTGNVSLFIDSVWPSPIPSISVTALFEDMASAAVLPDVGTTKDADLTVTWTLVRRDTCPTTMSTISGAINTFRTNPAVYGYMMGPDLPPAGQPDYENQTILETFDSPSAFNFTMADLTPEFRAAHPTLTTPDMVAAFFWGASNNGTFVINANDQIYDKHGRGTAPEGFTTTAQSAGFGYVLPQNYECDSKVIQSYSVTTKFTSGVATISKTGP